MDFDMLDAMHSAKLGQLGSGELWAIIKNNLLRNSKSCIYFMQLLNSYLCLSHT